MRKGAANMNMNQLLPRELLQTIPPLYANEHIPTSDVIIKAKYFLASFTWLVTEYEVQEDGDILFFGYVINHSYPDGSEWGYFSFNEMRKVRLFGAVGIERDLFFKPCKFSEYKK